MSGVENEMGAAREERYMRITEEMVAISSRPGWWCITTEASSSESPPPTQGGELKYKVGDVVVLREGTRFYFRAPGLLGRVVERDASCSMPYEVVWSDGSYNTYGEEDITYAHPEQQTSQPDEIAPNIKPGDVVKIVDLGTGYNRRYRNKHIGFYYTVLKIDVAYPLNWYVAFLKSTDPGKGGESLYFDKVKLEKLVKPEGEDE